MSQELETICIPRMIKSLISCTYYDTAFNPSEIQNSIVHYQDIENVDIYKSFNSALTQVVFVFYINFLYFSAQREVTLELTTTSTATLFCKAFYLYQPSMPFSFKLSGLTSEECPVYVHCIYANVKTENSLTQSYLFKTKLDYEV